jgi:bifunctional non-homologous end joining protein LigD
LRRTAVEERKRALAKLVRKASWAVQLNEHIAERGDIVFRHACKLGFEGIVSKRLGSPYVSGRSRHYLSQKLDRPLPTSRRPRVFRIVVACANIGAPSSPN